MNENTFINPVRKSEEKTVADDCEPDFNKMLMVFQKQNEKAMELIRDIYSRVELLKPIAERVPGRPSPGEDSDVRGVIDAMWKQIHVQDSHNDSLAEICHHMKSIVGT